MLLAALAVALTPLPAATDWRACVMTAARKWARNNEGADVVADGALGLCQEKEPAAVPAEERKRVKEQAIAAVLDRRVP